MVARTLPIVMLIRTLPVVFYEYNIYNLQTWPQVAYQNLASRSLDVPLYSRPANMSLPL